MNDTESMLGGAPTPPQNAQPGQEPAAPAASDPAEAARATLSGPDQTKPGPNAAAPSTANSVQHAELPGLAEKSFRLLSWTGLPVLLLLTLALTAPNFLNGCDLWFSDAVRHADVYMRFLEGDWLTLSLNGLPYTDKPPLYFWFLRALDAIPHVGPPQLFFVGAAASALIFITAAWFLARATGHDRRVAFAAGLMMIGNVYVAALANYPRMDLLFAAVINLSFLCLYLGWIRQRAILWLTLGFAFAGVAALIKGPLGLLFPLLASILFLIWRGTPGRLNGRDGVLGFLLMLLIPLAWVGALMMRGHTDYVHETFALQIMGRAVKAWHHAEPWWYYGTALPLIWLPWILLPLFVNWLQAAKAVPAAWKNRKQEGGRGWLWIILLAGTAALSAVSSKIGIYLLPLMPALAVLSARALLNLSPRRSRAFFFTVALALGLAGLLCVLAAYSAYWLPLVPEAWLLRVPPIAHAYLDTVSGMEIMGLILLVLAVVLIAAVRRAWPGGSLLITSIGIVALMQPYNMLAAPSLDTMLSPRAQAEAMARFVDQGYTAAAYKVYPGIYGYYLNDELARLHPDAPRPEAIVPDFETWDELHAFMAAQPRVVLALREKDWNRWDNKPDALRIVQRQWIVDQSYFLLTWENPEARADTGIPPSRPLQEDPPAQAPAVPAPSPDAPTANAPQGEANPPRPEPLPVPTAPESSAPQNLPGALQPSPQDVDI